MSVNKVILIGNLGKEPEVREVNGSKVAKFSLATTKRGFTPKEGPKVEDKTTWHDVEVWNGLAEVVEKYVGKGDKLYIEGELQANSWEAEDGTKKYRVSIRAFNLEMLTPKGQSGSANAEPVQDEPFDDMPF